MSTASDGGRPPVAAATGRPTARSPTLGGAGALLLAALLGALQTIAYVDTRWWPLPLAAIAGLAALAARSTPRRAAGCGLAYGTAWLGAGTWWLFVSLHDYGGLPAWMAVLAVGLLSAGLSVYLSAALGAFARWRRGAPGPDAALFAGLWLIAELARGTVFTGFPWIASGYAQVDAPLAALAPWLGVYGLGAVGAGLAAWCGLGLAKDDRPSSRRRWRAVRALTAGAATMGVLAWAGPGHHTTPAGSLTIALLQGDVPQELKFDPEAVPDSLAWTQARLLDARGRLVVGPETVVPLLPEQLDPAWWAPLLERFGSGDRAALLGLPLGDERTGYTNSAIGLSTDTGPVPGRHYRYDKHHLVPFGEFIPTGFRWFTRMMNIPLGDFDRGPVGAASFEVSGQRVAPNICYEDLFGEELAARFADPATAPTVFANLSNIGWFGDTIAIPQHLQISRMRTLEFQIPMVRATNTGATAAINAGGRLVASLPPFTRGVLETEVEGRAGRTPFAWWASRLGLWPLLLVALALVGASVATRRGRTARPSPEPGSTA